MFKQITLAYEVLNDDTRRQLYDKTGIYDETVKKGEDEDVLTLVSDILETVIINKVSATDSPLGLFMPIDPDIIKLCIGEYEIRKAKLTHNKTTFLRSKKELNRFIKNVKSKQGENLLQNLARSQLTKLNKLLKQVKEGEILLNKAYSIISNHTYEQLKQLPSAGSIFLKSKWMDEND